MEDNKNIDTTKAENQGQPAQEEKEKTFTQEEVNRIVQERLARSKNKEQPKGEESNTGAQDKERELQTREMNILAREKLLDAELSKDCMPLLTGASDEKDLDTRIELIRNLSAKKEEKPEKSKGFTPMGAPNNETHKGDNAIRQAMGLNS